MFYIISIQHFNTRSCPPALAHSSSQYLIHFCGPLEATQGHPANPTSWAMPLSNAPNLYWPPQRLGSDKAVSRDSQYVEKMCMATTVAHGKQHSA